MLVLALVRCPLGVQMHHTPGDLDNRLRRGRGGGLEGETLAELDGNTAKERQ